MVCSIGLESLIFRAGGSVGAASNYHHWCSERQRDWRHLRSLVSIRERKQDSISFETEGHLTKRFTHLGCFFQLKPFLPVFHLCWIPSLEAWRQGCLAGC